MHTWCSRSRRSTASGPEPRGTTEEGAIARFHFTRSGAGWTVDRPEYVPTVIDLGPPIRLKVAAAGSAAATRTDTVVLGRGAAAQGLTRGN